MYLDVSQWIPDATTPVPWRRIIDALDLKEKKTIIVHFAGLHFLVKKNVVDNILVTLEQVTSTAGAKNPLPEPYLYLTETVFLPYPIGDILADELHE